MNGRKKLKMGAGECEHVKGDYEGGIKRLSFIMSLRI